MASARYELIVFIRLDHEECTVTFLVDQFIFFLILNGILTMGPIELFLYSICNLILNLIIWILLLILDWILLYFDIDLDDDFEEY